MTAVTKVLLTGAAGRVGSYLRAGLPPLGWSTHCLDLVGPDTPDGLPWTVGDITDPTALDRACRGVGAIVHLAGIPTESDFDSLRQANIDGAYQVFEAARKAGVRRVLYASSNHAVGCYRSGTLLAADAPPRPDSLYGVTKAFGEALGRYYADRHGIECASIRIGSCFDRPPTVRALATWLSPGDAVRLVDALLRAPAFGHAVVYGISANTRAWWDLGPARALGYHPQDDAEVHAERLLATHGPLDPEHPDARYAGGMAAVGVW